MNVLQYSNKSNQEILKEFSLSIEKGLSSEEAKERLEKYGLNKTTEQTVHGWNIFFRQFRSPFIYLLFIALLLSWFLGETLEALMILFFVTINAFLGFYQEYHSEQAIKKLRQYITAQVKTRRDNQNILIDSHNLAPGDLVILETGDMVPADLRFLETESLMVDESILTGESAPVNKTSEKLKKIKAAYQAKNLGFTGTTVVEGKALGVILVTGNNTTLGHLSRLTIETVKENLFTKEISRFSKFILRLIILTLVFVFLANIIINKQGSNFTELIIFSIALAVSVIPEALPIVTTLSLSRGALRLAKQKVVVKRLSAIEDLGSIEILCTDKTGTLTENSLTLSEFSPGSKKETLLYANLASLKEKRKIEPFDLALEIPLSQKEKILLRKYQRLNYLPFDPKKRKNCVLVEKNKKKQIIVRGAPETILALSKIKKKEDIYHWIKKQGELGKRVLAVAYKNIQNEEFSKIEEKDLIFLGAISFADPIKKTTFEAVKKTKELGLSLKIITGDSKEVAAAVALKIGLIKKTSEVITGEELTALIPAKQREVVEHFNVFARVSPEEKYNIVSLLEEKHEVGFLGEGINDAPALKIATVSLVVQGASDIARGASDIILLQKNLKVIVDGIKEGREVFVNIAKYIKATMASNFGNFYAVAITSLFIPFLPMLPLQILLVNLLSDFPMISIAADSVDPKEISKPKKHSLREIMYIATILGILSTIFDFVFFGLFYKISPGVLQTNWFIASILTELVFLFSVRNKSLFFKGPRPAKIIIGLSALAFFLTIILPFTSFGQNIFSFIRPSFYHLTLIISLVFFYFLASEIIKVSYYKFFNKH